jgi:hypothetical protein
MYLYFDVRTVNFVQLIVHTNKCTTLYKLIIFCQYLQDIIKIDMLYIYWYKQ